ncbi:MAG: HD domain-containing protein [Anaerolineae bacterium]|nr:HD domain-containing protein [Anaerolineae bacterium]
MEALQPQPSPRRLVWPDEIARIRAGLPAGAPPVYLVGGTVRDAFLGRPVHDIDLATPGDGLKLARKLGGALSGAFYPLDAERGTGRVVLARADGSRLIIDVAQFRVREGDALSLETDLRARDFTVNALAVDIAGDLQAVFDPTGGLDDLQAKRLRLCAPDAIARDPTRALRSVRYSMMLGLHMDAPTREAVRRDGRQLLRVSAERVRDAFIGILDGPRPAGALRVLDSLGLLAQVAPEVEALKGQRQDPPHVYDVWEHTLAVIDHLDAVLRLLAPARDDNLGARAGMAVIVSELHAFRPALYAHLATEWPNERSMRSLLMLAALLHDAGKPETRSVDEAGRTRFFGHEAVGAEMAEAFAQTLRLSRAEGERLGGIVRHHMRPLLLAKARQVSGKSIYRFFRDTRDAGIDICLLALADYLGTAGQVTDLEAWGRHVGVVKKLLESYYERYEQVVKPRPLLDGRDIKRELQIQEGPEVGRLLRALLEAQADGEVSSYEEALALVRAVHRAE